MPVSASVVLPVLLASTDVDAVADGEGEVAGACETEDVLAASVTPTPPVPVHPDTTQ